MIRPFKIKYETSGGGNPVLLRTLKLKIDTGLNDTVPTWNWWSYNSQALPVVTSTGDATTVQLTGNANSIQRENVGAFIGNDTDFTQNVMYVQVYRGAEMLWNFSGLDATKNYTLQVAGGQNYNDAGDATRVSYNSSLYNLVDTNGVAGPNEANFLYKTIAIPILTPAGGTFSFETQPINGGGYTCISAMILKEYTT